MVKINKIEKVLICVTILYALYNLYEIGIVVLYRNSLNPPSTNAYFDFLLPILLILNLIWLIKAKNKAAVISTLLCVFSFVGAVVMLSHVSISPF
ncbi:MAG TPA: hypothetical protein VMR34_05505 [Candidatus Saccharimonadales bacterium]|nr:hypothetical protein [Candidatus Saccharimonadales bacterium]